MEDLGRFVPSFPAGSSSHSWARQTSRTNVACARRLSGGRHRWTHRRIRVCHEAESTSSGMESAPSFEHAARFSRGDLRRRVHETAVVSWLRGWALVRQALRRRKRDANGWSPCKRLRTRRRAFCADHRKTI
jgi:hypothetical protein